MKHQDNEANDKPQIDLFFTPAAVKDGRLRGYNVVVIDVLRASTSLVTALNNGARDIIPAGSINAVIELAADLRKDDLLLCGERDGRKVEGFHLGNSPSEYTRKVVEGKTIVLGTTNGTPAVIRASVAEKVLMACFVNLNAVIENLLKLKKLFPFAILCSGKKDSFAMEDVVCGGLLIRRLREHIGDEFTLNDAGKAAEVLLREFGNDLHSLLNRCDHGTYLKSIGLEEDLKYCAQDSVINLVPLLSEGSFINPKK